MKTITKSVLHLAFAYASVAQAPIGTIAGLARDPSGSAVAGAQVKYQEGRRFERHLVSEKE